MIDLNDAGGGETSRVEVYETLASESLATLVFHDVDAKLFVGTESGMVYRFDLQAWPRLLLELALF